jgi:heptosyltransferase-2
MSTPPPTPRIPASRIVVLMPNWLGDGVMATPFLRALRTLYPAAHIAAIARPLVLPVLTGLPFVNDIHLLQKDNPAATLAYLRANKFDLAIPLPNSFRSAWLFFRARIPHRLGYARDWRSPLLTARIHPQKRTPAQRTLDDQKAAAIHQISSGKNRPAIGSPYQPIPTIDYYLALATHLGATNPSKKMELAITAAERAEANHALATMNNEQSPMNNLLTLVPGANFGSSKCWPPEHFAQVADHLIDRTHATVLIASSPAELPIVESILAASRHRDRMIPLATLNHGKGLSLGALKELVRRSQLMICNDTGPRHFAAALGTPVVTLFGPTDPVWAETFATKERQVRIPVPCGPCQLKKCPIDHRCMTRLTPDLVLAAAEELLR